MTDERLQILQMVQEGRVSAAEALRLLDALSQATRAGGRGLRFRTVQSHTVDIGLLLSAIQRGATGKLFEAEEGGARIEVWLDE